MYSLFTLLSSNKGDGQHEGGSRNEGHMLPEERYKKYTESPTHNRPLKDLPSHAVMSKSCPSMNAVIIRMVWYDGTCIGSIWSISRISSVGRAHDS